MGKKALLALIGGVGALVSFALLSLVTKSLDLRGTYVLGVLSSIAAFAPIGISVAASVRLASPDLQRRRTKLIAGIVIGLGLAGVLFPLGVFGFYIAFFVLGVLISLTAHGASMAAVKSVLSSLGGLVAGGIATILWLGLIMVIWEFSLPDSEPLVVWIPAGLMSYGFTLGLLLFLPES